MRRSFAWLLAAALALSALVMWVPQRATTIVQAIDTRRSEPETVSLGRAASASPAAPLPVKLERPVIEPARRDPFADPAPLAPPPPPKIATAPAPPPAAPAPTPPQMTWRLLGMMESPTGERLVMLAPHSGQQSLLAAPGLRLEGGYEVVTVQPDAVRLLHPPTQTEVVIPIPPPQASGR